MFSSLRSKFKTRETPFEPVQFSPTEPAQASSSEPAKPLNAEEEVRALQIRGLCNRFRILIIGRANAGKTTILQKVCNTTKQPVIYNSKGKKVKTSILTPSNERGLHDITHEMVFKSNPGFIFHDSRGFEAGGTDELDNVKAFIAARSEKKALQDQVHAIWYCIPLDDSRPFTKAEVNFFSECGTGSVPVIAVFTKFDALEMKAYQNLLDKDHSREEAKAQASNHALDGIRGQVESLYKKLHTPKSHVYLRDMYKPDANCHELIKQTAAVINDDTLQLLFVSTQRNNLELCVEYSIKRVVVPQLTMATSSNLFPLDAQQELCRWFPNFYDHDHNRLINPQIICTPEIQSSLKSFIGSPPEAQQVARLGVALTIILEHAYFLWDQHRSQHVMASAIAHYKASHNYHAVMQAVDAAFDAVEGDNIIESVEALKEELIQIALRNRL